jgi:hypothetical protein
MVRVAALLVLATTAASGQAMDRAWYLALPTAGRILVVGPTQTGLLASNDQRLDDEGPHAQAWVFRPAAGATITIDLLSDEFDALLVVVGPGRDELLRNDDGAGRCNSRVTHTFSGGEYHIIVTSFGFGRPETGAFTLRASTMPPPVEDGPCDIMGDLDFDLGDFDARDDDITVDMLTAVPIAARLARGDSVHGILSDAAPSLDADRRALAYAVFGTPGAEVTLDAASVAFDTYLYVVHTDHDGPLFDDDSGGSCNARLTLTLPASGEIRVVVTAFAGNGEGAFQLGAFRTPPPARQGSCGGTGRFDGAVIEAMPTAGRIAVGQTREGELEPSDAGLDEYHADIWELAGRAGEHVVIELRSVEFDAYLGLTGPGLAMALTDDDGAGQCNSRIDVTFPETGTYRIVATTFRNGASGLYTLWVDREPGPEAEGGCAVSRESRRRLNALPLASTLAVGRAAEGQLDATATALAGGSMGRAYMLSVRSGAVYTVQLTSRDFDTFLYAVTPEGLVLDDDDCGGGTNSQLVLRPEAAGRWRIVASSFTEALGAYTLTVTDGPPAEECGDAPWDWDGDGIAYDRAPVVRQLQVGDEFRGVLSADDARHYDGTFFQAFEVTGRAGQSVTVDLLSAAFDAYLLIMGRGLPDMLRDDDSGGWCNSRILFVFPESGRYRIIVNTLTPDQRGPFTLRVSAAAPPITQGPCNLP